MLLVRRQKTKRKYSVLCFLLGQFCLLLGMILYALNCNYVFMETLFAIVIVITGAALVKRKSVTYLIWTSWYLFLDVLQYGECYVHAENYAKKNTYMNYFLNLSLLRDDSLRKIFFFSSTIFYVIILIVICVMEKIDDAKFQHKIAVDLSKQYRVIYLNPAVWLGIMLAFQYTYLRFAARGIIATSGIIYYASEAILYFLAVMLLKRLLNQNQSPTKTMLQVITVAVITSLPRLLTGSKSATIFAILILGMTVYMYNSRIFRNIMHFRIVFLAGLAVIFTFEVSYRLKFGQWLTSLDYFVRRFTGYNDGMAFLDYYFQYGNQFFSGGLKQWLDCILGIGNATNVNFFYTHNILGYSLEGVTSAAIPAFCSGLLYGNYAGLIITASVIAFIMSSLENGMRKSKKLEYVAVRVIIYINMVHLLFDGSIDNMKALLMTAAGCLATIFLTSILHIRFVLSDKNNRVHT